MLIFELKERATGDGRPYKYKKETR